MTRYTLADALPLTGAAAPLLTAAVGYPHPTTLTQLAKEAGISKHAASRAAGPLVSVGLLADTPDGYEFNDKHPLAPTITHLAWRLGGVRRHPLGSHPLPGPAREDFHYQSLVPRSLQLGQPVDPELDRGSGPDLVTARDTCDWLADCESTLRGFEQTAQEVYQLWSTERLRDIVHQTLHLGGAARAARHTLAEAATNKAQGDRDPYEAPVSAYAWTRATYLLSAEARDLLRVIEIMDQAIEIGGRANRYRAVALGHLHEINDTGRTSEFADGWVEEALEAEQRADQLWDSGRGRFHCIGGTPQHVDVGTAGDQILAVQLRSAARQVTAQVSVMAQAPCVQDWNATHPEAAQALATAVPSDLTTAQ